MSGMGGSCLLLVPIAPATLTTLLALGWAGSSAPTMDGFFSPFPSLVASMPVVLALVARFGARDGPARASGTPASPDPPTG